MGVDETGISGKSFFPSTSWSMVRSSADPEAPEHEQHLRRLVTLYWRPVYSVILHAWRPTPDDTRDLTQAFFAEVVLGKGLLNAYAPERGSFRAFLKASVINFLRNTTRDAARKRRGGHVAFVHFDAEELALAERLRDSAQQTPEELFDAAWNDVLITRAVALVEKRLVGQGDAMVFEVFKRRDLDHAEKPVSYAELGASLGMTVPQVKHALSQARVAFRRVVMQLVREYVDGPEELAAELRALGGV